MAEQGGSPPAGQGGGAAAAPPSAVVAVVLWAGRVLMIQRGPGVARAGYWSPPSGRVEAGERQPAGVVGEVREEGGLAVRAGAKVWECDTDDGGFRLHWWTATPTGPGEQLVCDPREVSAARWIRPEEFSTLQPTFAAHRHFFTVVLPELLRSGWAGQP